MSRGAATSHKAVAPMPRSLLRGQLHFMTATKKARQAHAARKNIIRLAGRLFAKSGYESTSMSEIAKSAGMEKASLYYHFKDKEQLFAAVMESVWSEMAAYLKKLVNDNRFMKKSPRHILAFIISHILKRNLRTGLAMMKMEQVHKGSKIHCEEAMCHIHEMRLFLRDFLRHNRIKHPEIAEQVIANAAYAYILHNRGLQKQASVEKYSQYLASLFFN